MRPDRRAVGVQERAPSSTARSPLHRLAINTAWLLAGKSFGAVCGLAYLAILTRSLGVEGFGAFSVIFGAAQALIALVGFESWRVVVRFGAEHVHHQDWDRFGRLAMLCGLLDALGAVVGCAIAVIALHSLSDPLHLDRQHVEIAVWFTWAMLWSLASSPTGVIRALHRFDVAVYVEAVVPIGRLVSALLIWWTGPSLLKFLLAWAVVDLVEAALYWAMASRLCPQAIRLRHLTGWRLALAENPRLVQFALTTHAGGSIDAVVRHGPVLIVGGVVSAASAGIYRLASQLAQAVGKLSALLTRSVYAEVTRTKVSSEAALCRLVTHTTAIAGSVGLVTVVLAFFFGADLVSIIAGREFQPAARILIPLSIAVSLELAGVAFEPVLHASGRAGSALMARLTGALAMAGSVVALSGYETIGVAWAVAIGSATTVIGLAILASRDLRNRLPEPATNETRD